MPDSIENKTDNNRSIRKVCFVFGLIIAFWCSYWMYGNPFVYLLFSMGIIVWLCVCTIIVIIDMVNKTSHWKWALIVLGLCIASFAIPFFYEAFRSAQSATDKSRLPDYVGVVGIKDTSKADEYLSNSFV